MTWIPYLTTCLYCETVFRSSPSSNRKYCSKACFDKHRTGKMRTSKIFTCLKCGKKFKVEKCQQKTRKYCSFECYKKQEEVVCLNCGKQFSAKISEHRKYCSQKCSRFHSRITRRGKKNSYWRGGTTKKGLRIRGSAEFQEWRKAVFIRDNYTCQHCQQRGGNLQAHHIKSFADYPELRFDINNGKTLCVKCHRKTFKRRNEKNATDRKHQIQPA